MAATNPLPLHLQRFVDTNSGNWKRVAVSYIEDSRETLDTALAALELVKKAHFKPNQLSPEEVSKLNQLYDRVKKAHPELGLT